MHVVKPLKHNHEAFHIAQADIAALILIWNEYKIINATIEVYYHTISSIPARHVAYNFGIFGSLRESLCPIVS